MKELYARLMYGFFPVVFLIDFFHDPSIPFVTRCKNVHKAWAEVFLK